MRVRVGVFWLCNFDIVYDMQVLDVTEKSGMIIDYEKEHRDVWERLSKEQFDGKYANYGYDFFKRGRVAYDCENGCYLIELNGYDQNLSQNISNKIKKLFKI